MTKEKTIKKILALGMKEYKLSSIENYDRAWQKILNEDKTLSINVRFWDFSKYKNSADDSFDIMIYDGREDDFAVQTNIYAFNDLEKVYKKALTFIKEI